MNVTVQLTVESLSRLDSFAAAWGVTRSEAVSLIFQAGLNISDTVPVGPHCPPRSTAGSCTETSNADFICPSCGCARVERCGTDFRCLDCCESGAFAKG